MRAVPLLARENPVTPEELRQAVLAAEHAAFTGRYTGHLQPEDRLKILLQGVPGGRIPADHPAAVTLAGLLCQKFNLYTPQLVDECVQAMSSALHGWPGSWEAVLRRVASEYYFAAFRRVHDDSKPKTKTPPLVSGLLLDGQPCVFGGQFKSMKTTLACDLAAALLTGTPYLGLAVGTRVPVLFLTRERTPHAVQAMIVRSAKRREPDHKTWARLLVTSGRSLVGTDGPSPALREYVAMGGARVVILDPLNDLLGDANATDLFAMGRQLRSLCGPIVEAGGTPVLNHHNLKSTPLGGYVGLGDLAGAGVAEFARSWLLLSRAAEYTGGGVHDLLAVAGTSEGNHARLLIRLNEETMEATATEPPTPTAKAGRRPQ